MKEVDQKPVEIWFCLRRPAGQDEARVGQKTKLTRRWAKRGTRSSALKDQRATSVWLFGSICPNNGKAAGLVMPWANSHAIAVNLKVISANISPDAHCVLVLDQPGWAYRRYTHHAQQHHPIAIAATKPRVQPRRKPLAIHACQLALKPHLQKL